MDFENFGIELCFSIPIIMHNVETNKIKILYGTVTDCVSYAFIPNGTSMDATKAYPIRISVKFRVAKYSKKLIFNMGFGCNRMILKSQYCYLDRHSINTIIKSKL